MVALLAVLLSTVSVEATHELTVGTALYSDGTVAKTAAAGDTLSLIAVGAPAHLLRQPGEEGGIRETNFVYRVTIGKRYRSGDKDIPCYEGFRFISGEVNPGPGGTLPSTPFVVDAAPGEWEVCWYSRGFQYVTSPVQLTVTASPPPARARGYRP